VGDGLRAFATGVAVASEDRGTSAAGTPAEQLTSAHRLSGTAVGHAARPPEEEGFRCERQL